jgi:hypothetical protein
MDLPLAILLGIDGLGTVVSALWVFAIWKTGGLRNFFDFENGETVPSGAVPGCAEVALPPSRRTEITTDA